MQRAELVGEGAQQFMATTFRATVVGEFGRGFYLAHHGELMAVVDHTVAAGPLYLRLDGPMLPPALGAGVEVDRDGLSIGGWQIDGSAATAYRPQVPSEVHRSPLVAQLRVETPAVFANSWDSVVAAVVEGDLFGAQRLLGGRGQGLTPEGDDVLAALLVTLAGHVERRGLLARVAASAQTTDLSKAFLKWAAAGQSVEQLHQLLSAAKQGDGAAFDRAAARVRCIGGSTGTAMLCGVALAGYYLA